jgi:hypothetical protein
MTFDLVNYQHTSRSLYLSLNYIDYEGRSNLFTTNFIYFLFYGAPITKMINNIQAGLCHC